jgi:endonuclease/exonuclease/phosphatase family metal-dependent hydrolase
LIIAGDLNDEYYSLPSTFERLGRGKNAIVDLFESESIDTFQQEWDKSGKYKMDYLFMNKEIAQKMTFKKGGIKAYRSSLKISDHAPLLVEIGI